jgi:arylsulfatase
MRVMDLAPTFIQLAGGDVPADMMGRSLLPRVLDGKPVYSADEFIAAETYGRRMAQQGNWKVLLQAAPYGTGDWQLYNLAEDLGEQNDLSDEFPERRASLIDAWQQYADQVGVINPEVPIRY